MSPLGRRPRGVSLGIGMVGLIASVLVIVLAIDSPAWGDSRGTPILVTFGLVIVVGEWLGLHAPGSRVSAPVATAAAFGLAFAVEVSEGYRVPYASSVVLAVTALAMAVGTLVRRLTDRPMHPVETVGRFVAVLTVVLLYRNLHLHQQPGRPPADDGLPPWQQAVLMLGIAIAGVIADVVFTSSTNLPRGLSAWRWAFVVELRSAFPLSSALAVTGVLIALAAKPLGLVALPLFLVPLVLTQFAFRRYVAVRATYRQSIGTLSRLTDLAGYTPPGHSERVAELALAVGRELGVGGRELLDLEYAALLHDIGQVALVEPIPGGATVLAAPADQRRIAWDTVAIIRETGVLEDVAQILEHQATPFRQVREFGEDIPLASRIIKVINAFEDLTGGARTEQAIERALERIFLGLGYEYDPRIVDALPRALRELGTPVQHR